MLSNVINHVHPWLDILNIDNYIDNCIDCNGNNNCNNEGRIGELIRKNILNRHMYPSAAKIFSISSNLIDLSLLEKISMEAWQWRYLSIYFSIENLYQICYLIFSSYSLSNSLLRSLYIASHRSQFFKVKVDKGIVFSELIRYLSIKYLYLIYLSNIPLYFLNLIYKVAKLEDV